VGDVGISDIMASLVREVLIPMFLIVGSRAFGLSRANEKKSKNLAAACGAWKLALG
jgi:hypothetical protein